MEEQKKEEMDIDLSQSTKLPGSKEGEVVIPRETSPDEESDAVSSAREEELFVSPGGGSSVGGPKSPSADTAAWETTRRARLAEKKKRQRQKKRQREREAKEEERLKREDPSRKATYPCAAASSSAGTSTDVLAGRSGPGHAVLNKGGRDQHRAGQPARRSGPIQAATRGPGEIEARRKSNRQ